MKQTAVDWYFTELWTAPRDKFIWHSILIKAKEMEKEQISEGYKEGYFNGWYNDDGKSGEEYYNETYGEK
jgi:hypothetical protein